jgi:hypothetical protein
MVRGLSVTGTQQGVILWDDTLSGITFDGVTISSAIRFGVRYESDASNIAFTNITTMSSGSAGWYSSLGAQPAGVTFAGDSWN